VNLAEPKAARTEALRLRVVSESNQHLFLGLTTSERNRRVAFRTIGSSDDMDDDAPTLTIPSGVVITPALFSLLPPPAGVSTLTWDPSRPPLRWQNGALPSIAKAMALPADVVLDVSTSEARKRTAWQLLRASGKPTDGWLSRHVHRRVSRMCSYVLLLAGITANQASVLVMAIGILSAWFMAQTTHATMIAGASLFWFASIADGIDGEIARLTMTESARGQQIDTAADDATYVFALAGTVLGWWRQGIGMFGAGLAVAVACGLGVMVLRGMALVRRASGARRFFVAMTPIELGVKKAAAASRSPLLRAASGVWPVFRREALSLAFFLVALVTSSRAIVPMLLAAGLLTAAATLLVYEDEIVAAMRAYFSARL
jgi:phosphatidylglycerophosphate synthase